MPLASEVSLDAIDEWFRIGKEAATKSKPAIKVLSDGKFRGRLLDPKTKEPVVQEKTDFDRYCPAYKRGTSQSELAQYELLIRQSRENVEDDGFGMKRVTSQLEQLELESTVAASSAAEFAPAGGTVVYDNYSFEHKYDPKLPITQTRDEVILTIESNQVTIIQGSTGSGKTTQVPQFILDHYAAKGEYCNIIVTQPRRIAAMSIAKRVCQERDWPLGSICGYQIGMEMKASEDTRILYCTTGVLREKLIGKKNMHQFTHVILDEVHERNQESDFALLVAKKLLRTNSQHVKVILMSATMNCEEFASYFALPVRDLLESAPVVSVEGQVFKVSEFFADNLEPLGKLPQFEDGKPELHHEIVDIAVKLIQEFDKLEVKEQGIDQSTGFATVRGTVLVFLPGIHEICFMLEKLRTIETKHHLTLIPLHSTITIDEQSRVFEKPQRSFRKVILSTNIAESSITVPDIKYVIDFCLTKNLVCDVNTHYTHLQLEWASHSNCIQRKGRAGRVSQGRAYYMVTKDFYENFMADYSIPEMQRCPLNTLVLKTKLLDMGEPMVVLSQALSPPDLAAIEKTILELKQVGALCITSNGVVKRFDGDLTFVGRVLADLPVDIHLGKLMVLGYVFGLLEETIIIAAALSLKSIFATPFQSKMEAFMHKYRWASGSQSDCQAILQAYRVWERCKQLQEFQRSGRTERQWGEKHFIQTRRINEVHELVSELRQRLEKFNLVKVKPRSEVNQQVTNEEPGELTPKDSLFLKIIMCGAFYPSYFFKKERDEVESMRELSNHDPSNTVAVRGLPQNQGALYRERIIKLFSVCCPHGTKPTVDVEESRAYIQFPWSDKDSATVVNPAVCFAIKLRQLRIPLSMEIYDKMACNSMMQMMQDAHEQVASQGFLRTNRVKGDDSEVVEGEVPMCVALPDPSQSVLEVVVTEVMQCGHFYAQCLDHRNLTNMRNITVALNPASKLSFLTVPAHKGMMCAAPYIDEQEAYYRAKVEGFEMQTVLFKGVPKAVHTVKVIFVDYGNKEIVPVEKLRMLPAETFNIPFLAFECELTEIRPSSVKCPDGKWTKEANNVFTNMVLGKKFLAQIYSVVHQRVRLELVHHQSNGMEVSINQQLISLMLADKAEETYLSKQDHDWRMLESTAAAGNMTDRSIAAVAPQTALSLNIKTPDSSRRKGRRINLVGPYSPLEMEFVCMTQAGAFRAVTVEPESVNSAAVDPSPQVKFLRMMVAAFASSNPDGRRIIARDTTIMPLVPGLHAIMCLLFAPVAEFRIDKDKTRYIGALCGLGYNPDDRSLPLLPDTDIEVTFDVNIDDEDINLINRVRHAINLAVGSRTNTAEWDADTVASRIQVPARDQLLRLLHKSREYTEPQYYTRQYLWNQLSKQDLVAPDADFDNEFMTLLPPHPSVQLAMKDDDTLSVDLKRQHIDDLHRIATVHVRGPVRCDLCRLTLMTSQLLAVHLETERHQRQEQKVFSHYADK